VKRLTSASATAQIGAPVALRLTMRTALKHPMQLSGISRGICSLILGYHSGLCGHIKSGINMVLFTICFVLKQATLATTIGWQNKNCTRQLRPTSTAIRCHDSRIPCESARWRWVHALY
jgi:hypothetical protein